MSDFEDIVTDLEDGVGLTDEELRSEFGEGDSTEAVEQPQPEESAPEPTPEEQPTEAEAAAEDPPDEGQPEPTPDPEFEIDGEKYSLDQIKAWRARGLRQADYTRKTQELAQQRQNLASQRDLANDVANDPHMKELLRVHPELFPNLLSDPQYTRSILGDKQKIKQLWEDYAPIADNPRLRSHFLRSHEQADQAAQEYEKAANFMRFVAERVTTDINQAITEGKFEGMDPNEVREHVLRASGMDPNIVNEGMTPQEFVQRYQAGFQQLFRDNYITDQQGNIVPNGRIATALKAMAFDRAAQAPKPEDKASAHNQAVQAKLQEKRAPATPGGQGPAGDPAPEYMDWSYDKILEDLQEM